MNFAVRFDFFFVTATFFIMIVRIAVQNIDVLRLNINVVEKIVMHEAVIAFRVFFRKTHIFIHVECDHMFKTHFTGLV